MNSAAAGVVVTGIHLLGHAAAREQDTNQGRRHEGTHVGRLCIRRSSQLVVQEPVTTGIAKGWQVD